MRNVEQLGRHFALKAYHPMRRRLQLKCARKNTERKRKKRAACGVKEREILNPTDMDVEAFAVDRRNKKYMQITAVYRLDIDYSPNPN